MAEVLTTLFSKEIQSELFPNNEFYKNSRFDGKAAADQKTVEIPQAGAVNITKNPVVGDGGLSTSGRTDDKRTYDLDEYAAGPHFITDKNQMETSYDKRADMVKAISGALNARVADELAVAWSAVGAAHIIRTSGANDAGSLPNGTATGTRKELTLVDVVAAMTKLDKDDCPSQGRIMVLPAGMYGELMTISEFIEAQKFGKANLPEGAIGKLLGFDVFMRSRVATFDNTGTPVVKAVGAAEAVSDNGSILCYHKDFVRRAEGTVKVFLNPGRAEYLGDLMSAAVRAGGTHGRNDLKGVVSIVQAA